MTDPLIRRATDGDRDGCVALFALWPGHERDSLQRGFGDWRVHLVAELDGQVVGYAAVTPCECDLDHYPETRAMGDNWGFLADLLVHPDLRSQGCGQRLLKAAEDVARKSGARGLAVNPDATGDRRRLFRFYERCGYTAVPPSVAPEWPYFFRAF